MRAGRMGTPRLAPAARSGSPPGAETLPGRGAAWCNPPVILRSIRARAALSGLAVVAVACAAGCSASVNAEANTGSGRTGSGSNSGSGSDSDQDGALTGSPERSSIRRISGRPPTATFPGFRVLDEDKRQSLVMVEVSREIEVREQKAEGRLVYVLENTQVGERVNRLPLVATHFGTAVSSIHLEQSGSDVLLVIETRAPVTATHRKVQTDNGVNVEVAISGDPWGRGEPDAHGPYQRTDAPKTDGK